MSLDRLYKLKGWSWECSWLEGKQVWQCEIWEPDPGFRHYYGTSETSLDRAVERALRYLESENLEQVAV